jgi:hypothetical protein
MTSYSAMAERGREEARARTAGRRKPVVIRLDYSETPEPDMPPGCYIVKAALIGKCGHVLDRKQWQRYVDPRYPAPVNWKLDAMRRKVGHRMTCQHDDCRIATAL